MCVHSASGHCGAAFSCGTNLWHSTQFVEDSEHNFGEQFVDKL
jgi:hypothetical protein